MPNGTLYETANHQANYPPLILLLLYLRLRVLCKLLRKLLYYAKKLRNFELVKTEIEVGIHLGLLL